MGDASPSITCNYTKEFNMRKDSWGRYIRPEPQPDPRYQQQLSFTFVPRECTPEEQHEWQEKDLSAGAE